MVDPDFETVGGHNFPANQYFAARVKKPVYVISSQRLSASITIRNAEILRELACTSNKAIRLSNRFKTLKGTLSLFSPGGLTRSHPDGFYVPTLKAMFSEVGIAKTDKILVHTGSDILLHSLMAVASELGSDVCPEIHYRSVRIEDVKEYSIAAHQQLVSLVKQGTAYVYSETDSYRHDLADRGHNASAIDKLELAELAETRLDAPTIGSELRVAILGGPRLEKGCMRLLDIGQHYQRLGGGKNLPKLRYVIHTPDRKKFVRRYAGILRRMKAQNILFEYSEETGMNSAYLDKMLSSHVVMLPYDPARYASRGSGLGCDAIANGRVILSSADCTMTEYVRNGNGLTATSNEEFAACLLKIATDYETFNKCAKSLCDEFVSRLSNNSLLSRLNA